MAGDDERGAQGLRDQSAEAGLDRPAGAWQAAGSDAGLNAVLHVETPVPGIAGFYDYNTASFGPPVDNPGAFGILAVVPADAGQRRRLRDRSARRWPMRCRGKIAMIDRGVCGFAVKAKNAQNAGAFGVIIVNNAAGVRARAWAAATRRSPSRRSAFRRLKARCSSRPSPTRSSTVSRGRPGAVVASVCVRRFAQGGSRCVGSAAAVHAEPADRRLVGIALGRERVPQPADGAEHQRRT